MKMLVVTSMIVFCSLNSIAASSKDLANLVLRLKAVAELKKSATNEIRRDVPLIEFELSLTSEPNVHRAAIAVLAQKQILPVACSTQVCKYSLSPLLLDDAINQLQSGFEPSPLARRNGNRVIAKSDLFVCYAGDGKGFASIADCHTNGNNRVIPNDAKTGCVIFDPKNGETGAKAVVKDGRVIEEGLTNSGLKKYRNCSVRNESLVKRCDCRSEPRNAAGPGRSGGAHAVDRR